MITTSESEPRSNSDLTTWLEAANRRYAAEGIEHQARPFKAMNDFTREHRCSLPSSHPTCRAIFEWFYKNSPPKAHQMGSVYTGVFLFDTAFWPIQVPLIFGEVSVDALSCLATMPLSVKNRLSSSHSDSSSYARHWLNCMDYGCGRMDGGMRLKPRARKFLNAAHAELLGANSLLLESRPNVKAILGMRMATEILLKTVLVQECDLSEDDLRKIGHNLKNASEKCHAATGGKVFQEIACQISVFPPITARYEDTNWSPEAVWNAAILTQCAAATVTRRYTDRNLQAALWLPREQAE